MKGSLILITLLVISSFCVNCGEVPQFLRVGGLFGVTQLLDPTQPLWPEELSAAQLAVDQINNSTDILPGTFVELLAKDTKGFPTFALEGLIGMATEGARVTIGAPTSDECGIAGIASIVYGIPMVSHGATSSTLTDPIFYTFFNRVVPPDNFQAQVILDIIDSYNDRYYRDIALVSTADDYGVEASSALISSAEEYEINVLTYQQFLAGAEDITIEMEELVASEARLFVSFMLAEDFKTVLYEAYDYELIGKYYVWICADGCANVDIFKGDDDDDDDDINEGLRALASGLIGTTPTGGQGVLFEQFLETWATLDPVQYPGASTPPEQLSIYVPLAYDASMLILRTYDALFNSPVYDNYTSVFDVPTEVLNGLLKNTTFNGVTGPVVLDPLGDRIGTYTIVNLYPGRDYFTEVGTWTTAGYNQTRDIFYFDGTTDTPFLGVETPFDYWSCHDREEYSDSTGKLSLETPDGSDPNFISSHYICDQFIDCDNMSDEGFHCNPSFVALFIAFGIITGLLILLALLFIPFTIIFGFIIKRRRVRASSPVFLIIIDLSVVLGYIATYSWYGKPHPVACAFQPWLLGLAVISMVSALFSKTFRIWRLFRSPLKVKVIRDVELLVLWVILIIPAILILFLWTLISTPTATVVERNNEDHYVCETGGFTGPPGGIVFFFILVGYLAIVLLFGVFLSFVTRKVPSLFNESKLIAISIYNLIFLSVVVIPIYFVLRDDSPFAAWVIRNCAILYAFTATLWLQFIPKIFGVVVHDRKNDGSESSTKGLESVSQTQTQSTGSAHL